MSSKDNLALDLEHGVRRWDRPRWISVFSSHNPTIREVTECLGLGLSASSSTTNRGIPKFDNPDYRKLSSEVTKLSKELPKERDALLDFAADPRSLDKELEELLYTYGSPIWGRDADRACLLKPDPVKKTYNKDLIYEEPEHKETLKIHLHRWIIIKACYYIRNMKLKRPSGANDYDTLADIDGEGGVSLVNVSLMSNIHTHRPSDKVQSPRGTPQSLTPPEHDASAGAEFEVKPVNLKKRKSSFHLSTSDGEEHSASPAKRPYHTMPVSRKDSPRKTLKSLYPIGLASLENIPPLLSHAHQISQRSPPPGSVSEPPRVHLSPLASNELNSVSRPPSVTQTPTPAGFTAVNSGGFTAVNTSPPVSEPVREAPRAPSREPQLTSPTLNHRDAPTYTSPYEPASRSSTTTNNASDHRFVPPPNTTPATAQGFQPVNSPVIINGVSNRGSPAMQHSHHAPVAPQPQPQVPQQLPHQTSPQAQHPIQPHVQPQAPPPTHILSQPHTQSQQQPINRPPSRTETSSVHHFGRSLAPHPTSRSSTPLAQAATNQPPTAPNAQVTPAPKVQSAPAYGMQLVPTQNTPAPAPSSQFAPTHHISPAPQHPVHHHQPTLRSQPTESPQTTHAAQPPPRPAVPSTDLRLLQCEVTAGLFTFFYPRSSAPPDEPALLQRLHTLWYHGAGLFERELGAHFAVISKILTAWLHERQAITALRHSLAAQPGVSPGGLVDRLLAMNDLRVMRLKWKNMSTIDGLSPEDLLCMAFRVMTNTEGSEYLFKEGLDRLNGGVFEFLRSEDAKIVMQRR